MALVGVNVIGFFEIFLTVTCINSTFSPVTGTKFIALISNPAALWVRLSLCHKGPISTEAESGEDLLGQTKNPFIFDKNKKFAQRETQIFTGGGFGQIMKFINFNVPA